MSAQTAVDLLRRLERGEMGKPIDREISLAFGYTGTYPPPYSSPQAREATMRRLRRLQITALKH